MNLSFLIMVNHCQFRRYGISAHVVLCFLIQLSWHADACQLFRRRNGSMVDWWVCTSCSSKLECCQLHYHNNSLDDDHYCAAAMAEFPVTQETQTEFAYSLFLDTAHNDIKIKDSDNNHLFSLEWEKFQPDTETWKIIPHHPFRDDDKGNDNDMVSSSHHEVSLKSTVTESGGMHRLWKFRLSVGARGRQPKFSVLVFLTSNLFVDVEDWIVEEQTNDHTMIQLKTENLIDIEAPSMYSPQHVLVLSVNTASNDNTDQNEYDDIEFSIRLHLRYLTPSNTTTATILLPPPLIWNSHHASEQQEFVVIEASRARANDLWLAWSVTLVCSIVSSLILLKDILNVCRWN